MPFRIKRRERVDEAVQRIVSEQLETAAREASDAHLPLDQRVHAIRSRVKKARAALRLVQSEGDRAVATQERALRDLARSLANARDAAVSHATLERLAHEAGGAHASPLGPAEQAAEERDLQRAIERLGALRRRAFRVPHGGRVARAAFTSGYREGRRLLRELRPDESGPRFHDWRKVVKRLSLQLRILERAAPDLRRALGRPLGHLPDLLGEIHDLSVLHAQLEGQEVGVSVDAEGLRGVLARLRAESSSKRTRALQIGARVFATKPSEVRARLDDGWRRWRN
jgi:CHAD domain-containing protein